MRRQGFEFAVSRPQVIYKKDENGKLLEPMELLMIEVPEQYVGAVMEKLGARKAEIVNMGTRDTRGQPSGIPDPRPGPDGLPPAVPHRHQRQRDYEQRVRRV